MEEIYRLMRGVAGLHNVSRKTIVRDFAHMKACGLVLSVYRPPSLDREQWLQLSLLRAQPPGEPATATCRDDVACTIIMAVPEGRRWALQTEPEPFSYAHL